MTNAREQIVVTIGFIDMRSIRLLTIATIRLAQTLLKLNLTKLYPN